MEAELGGALTLVVVVGAVGGGADSGWGAAIAAAAAGIEVGGGAVCEAGTAEFDIGGGVAIVVVAGAVVGATVAGNDSSVTAPVTLLLTMPSAVGAAGFTLAEFVGAFSGTVLVAGGGAGVVLCPLMCSDGTIGGGRGAGGSAGLGGSGTGGIGGNAGMSIAHGNGVTDHWVTAPFSTRKTVAIGCLFFCCCARH